MNTYPKIIENEKIDVKIICYLLFNDVDDFCSFSGIVRKGGGGTEDGRYKIWFSTCHFFQQTTIIYYIFYLLMKFLCET